MNPYNCTKPGNLFVGYEDLRQKILNGFRNGNSYALIGGRRCGKTSFLMRIEKDIREKGIPPLSAIPGQFSLHECDSEFSSAMLFKRMYELVVRDVKDPPVWNQGDSGRDYEIFLRHLDKAAPMLNRQYGNDWLVILLIDEMDTAAECLPDDGFFQNLRHFLMQSRFNRHFRVLATGVKGMARLISKGSPLNNLRNTYLRVLTYEEAKTLVSFGFPLATDSDMRFLLELTGRHPFMLQGILENMPIDNPSWDKDSISRAAHSFMEERGRSDFEQWTEKFESVEKAVYQALAESNKQLTFDKLRSMVEPSFQPATRDAVSVLTYHGVIEAVTTQELKIAGILFKDWFSESVGTEQSVENRNHTNDIARVFISYASEDLQIAMQLYRDLKNKGINAWIDRENLVPGQDREHVIRRSIRESSYFLTLISSVSVSRSGFVQKEQRLALDALDGLPPDRIFIIPVCIDGCEPIFERLRDLHPVDLSDYESGLRQILKVLRTPRIRAGSMVS